MTLTRRIIMIMILLCVSVLTLLGQGLAISVLMRGAKRNLDERFVSGKFFWKPKLPMLFRSGRAAIVPSQRRTLGFAPPFLKMKGKN